MNYSISMKVNTNRIIIAWLISLIIVAAISSSVTALFVEPEIEEIHHHHSYYINQEVIASEPLLTSLGEYTVTAYCGCEECCGIWGQNRTDGIVYGAGMDELKQGISIATSKEFPFGTNLIIDGQEYTVQDRIANWVVERYEGKIIDVYFSNHEEAVKFGKQIKEVYLKGGSND